MIGISPPSTRRCPKPAKGADLMSPKTASKKPAARTASKEPKAAGPREGDRAPAFTMPTDGGGSVSLAKLKGRNVVLYFYPKDDTSGCTAEACGFRDSFPDYGKTGAVVIGVSRDSVASHDKFKQKHGLPFILASDSEGKVTEDYGVWVEKSKIGRAS